MQNISDMKQRKNLSVTKQQGNDFDSQVLSARITANLVIDCPLERASLLVELLISAQRSATKHIIS